MLKNLGDLYYFLGIQVSIDSTYLQLTQTKYIDDLLGRFNMEGCKPCSTPLATSLKLDNDLGCYVDNPTEFRALVSALQYVTWTRLDISFATNLVAQFQQQPRVPHLEVAKRILRYLKGTIHYGITLN